MMLRTKDESHIGPQPEERARREPNNPKVSIWKRLDVMCPRNMQGTTSWERETHSPVGRDVTNVLLVELL